MDKTSWTFSTTRKVRISNQSLSIVYSDDLILSLALLPVVEVGAGVLSSRMAGGLAVVAVISVGGNLVDTVFGKGLNIRRILVEN